MVASSLHRSDSAVPTRRYYPPLGAGDALARAKAIGYAVSVSWFFDRRGIPTDLTPSDMGCMTSEACHYGAAALKAMGYRYCECGERLRASSEVFSRQCLVCRRRSAGARAMARDPEFPDVVCRPARAQVR